MQAIRHSLCFVGTQALERSSLMPNKSLLCIRMHSLINLLSGAEWISVLHVGTHVKRFDVTTLQYHFMGIRHNVALQ